VRRPRTRQTDKDQATAHQKHQGIQQQSDVIRARGVGTNQYQHHPHHGEARDDEYQINDSDGYFSEHHERAQPYQTG